MPHNFHPAYRADIDGLRALAILSVVIFHAFPSHLPGGFVGVDIFFVISGFLISNIIFKSLERNDFSFTEFYAHRIKRIFPALIFILSAVYVIGWFSLLPDEFKQLGKHMAAGTGFVQNVLLWKEAGYFDTASELKPLMHLWSLGIEEQFYIVFPILVWCAWRLGLNALTLIIGLALLSFWLNLRGIKKDAVMTFFMPQTRFWELLAGSLLAYQTLFHKEQLQQQLEKLLFHPIIFRKPPAPEKQANLFNNALGALGILLLAGAITGINKAMSFPGWWALLPVVGTVLLIRSGPESWINRHIFGNRLMVWIGLISYPLYLWHWPLLSLARIVESETPSRNIRLAAVAISFLLAWATYRLIEKPIRFGRTIQVKTAALCLLAAAIGYTGYNTFTRDGLGFRLKHANKNTNLLNWGKNSKSETCAALFPLITAKVDHCRVHDEEKLATILLVGDSHSNHLWPRLARLSPGNIANIANGGCLPFFDTESAPKTQLDVCRNSTNQVLQTAEKNPDIKTLILSSRGSLYLSGKGFGEEPGEKSHDRFISFSRAEKTANNPEIFEQAMRYTLQRLLATGKTIVFVIDVPELGFDPRLCLDSRPLRLTARIKSPCALSRADFDERNHAYRELVFSVLKDFPKVIAFDAAAPFCDNEYCWAMKNGRLLYRDDDHLSEEGSRFIAPYLLKAIAGRQSMAP